MTSKITIIKDAIKEVAFKRVSDNDELIKSGILSSILLVDLATALEEAFSVSIPFTEINAENFSTPEKIENYIDSKS